MTPALRRGRGGGRAKRITHVVLLTLQLLQQGQSILICEVTGTLALDREGGGKQRDTEQTEGGRVRCAPKLLCLADLSGTVSPANYIRHLQGAQEPRRSGKK